MLVNFLNAVNGVPTHYWKYIQHWKSVELWNQFWRLEELL